jgi:phenylacetic acid degradation operon negative regulatory protein
MAQSVKSCYKSQMSRSPISAPELALSLFDSMARPALTAGYLVKAAGLFGIDPATMRVALARLVKRGVLAQQGRGEYRIGGGGERLQAAVYAWADVEKSIQPWRGGWLAAYTGHLTRTVKTTVRGRERALTLRGFAAFDRGLWLRPDNLVASPAAVRDVLVTLGLDPQALVFRLEEPNPDTSIDAQALWSIAEREALYARRIQELQDGTRALPSLDLADAARETLLLGRAVTREILKDPLLPSEMIDSDLRHRMIADMVNYNRGARRCWSAFYRASR